MPKPHDKGISRDCSEVRHNRGRLIKSVSDLYGSDEIEVLLEEIRELTPGTFHGTESFQDFEIAGSRTGMNSGSTAEEKCSETLSIHSWDSHAIYHQQLEESSDSNPVFTGVVIYCDSSHLKTCTGFLRVVLVISSVACLACLCTSGTAKAGLFMLPLIGRLRFMMFVTVFTLLVTCLLLFLDISHLVYIFPFNWSRLNAVLYVSVSVLYIISSSLVMNTVQFYNDYHHWVPKWTRDQLIISGTLGYICATEALLLSLSSRCAGVNIIPRKKRRPKSDDVDHMSMVERRNPNAGSSTPTHEGPSTSTMWPIDDVQPCSSKHFQQPMNTYHVNVA